ncbi:class II glutamine amidotransferase [Zhongshania arctica]|uniref:Class II glutamine amidotransferase n=1 Tax=Zhongshania arctica TaxID=3238302 RepID=A0ABV3TW62_9GAMM
MCELLGMSANVPTDICFSFAGLSRRGGETGPHVDGWGIVFYEEGGVREFKDYMPSHGSKLSQFLSDYPIKSHIVISHIRQANVGGVGLENTHPFQRELWGQAWSYAHNGQVPAALDLANTRFSAIGSTDSERIFCWLMDSLAARFDAAPDPQVWADYLSGLCESINKLGVFNLLLTNGNALFCFCSTKLCWITRRAPFGVAQLSDKDLSIDFAEVTTDNDIVTMIATQALTNNEVWHTMAHGECRLFVAGESVWECHTRAVLHASAASQADGA